MDMTFNEAINLYRDVIKRFEKIEKRPWGAQGAVIELAKQVGDLAKCVMIQEKYYFYTVNEEENKKQIADELADIFGQIIRIADHYQIDLLQAHIDARKGETNCLKENGV